MPTEFAEFPSRNANRAAPVVQEVYNYRALGLHAAMACGFRGGAPNVVVAIHEANNGSVALSWEVK